MSHLLVAMAKIGSPPRGGVSAAIVVLEEFLAMGNVIPGLFRGICFQARQRGDPNEALRLLRGSRKQLLMRIRSTCSVGLRSIKAAGVCAARPGRWWYVHAVFRGGGGPNRQSHGDSRRPGRNLDPGRSETKGLRDLQADDQNITTPYFKEVSCKPSSNEPNCCSIPGWTTWRLCWRYRQRKLSNRSHASSRHQRNRECWYRAIATFVSRAGAQGLLGGRAAGYSMTELDKLVRMTIAFSIRAIVPFAGRFLPNEPYPTGGSFAFHSPARTTSRNPRCDCYQLHDMNGASLGDPDSAAWLQMHKRDHED